MSLTPVTTQYRIGLIAATSFDNQDFFADRFGSNLDKISHVYTNGANQLVIDFCRLSGLVCTIFPVNKNSVVWSNSRIIENSDKVYILGTPSSHNTPLAKAECEKQKRKFEVIEHEPVEFWREKVMKTREIMECMSKEDAAESQWVKAIAKVI